MCMNINPDNKLLLLSNSCFGNNIPDILVGYGFHIVFQNCDMTKHRVNSIDEFDLVLIYLPSDEVLTIDCIAAIRKDFPQSQVPILFCLNKIEYIQQAFDSGGTDFFRTPFDKDEVVMRIVRQIELFNSPIQNITAKDEIYSIIGHDLRAPMSSLKMLLTLLISKVDRGSISDEVYDIINVANEVAEESYLLLDNLLKWIKNETGYLEPMLQKIDLVSLSKDVIGLFRYIAMMKGITINFNTIDKAEIEADIDMIRTSIRNLISNALKFSPNNSVINVSIVDKKSSIVFSVEDFGCGINDKYKSLIRRRISDINSLSNAKLETESGLGLLLAQKFIIKNNGRFWFNSQEGIGSKFSFSLDKA